ncbi:hypothetical protein LPJ57_002682 [Coemansia sp. RSA 486]|nr:hypothetical protein LPJ57_002682 [Coemansia sp. RSA 486]KAJ2234703.1 hypothetical protein IWW45_003188 [Coemansia sp. RSA 485]KAJ2596342.1 hypothetical protein GGF39_003486 [Coemansia sp. RSA 1721]
MLKTYTGYTVEDIAPAVYHAGLDMSAKQCCSEETRYKYYDGEVEPEQRWSLQPFHRHMLVNFQNADICAHMSFFD